MMNVICTLHSKFMGLTVNINIKCDCIQPYQFFVFECINDFEHTHTQTQ